MTAITLDTFKFVNQLKEAGIAPAHAEAQAHAFSEIFEKTTEKFMTKENIYTFEDRVESKFQLLRKDIAAMEERFNSKIIAMDERFNSKLVSMENRIDARFLEMKSEMVEMKLQITIRLGSLIAGGVAILIALSKFS